ncbi:MAG: hypothetical protein KDE23_19310, partial [Caldilinea sp.]|nr:hypothetical protein [Caldilinea sp.]
MKIRILAVLALMLGALTPVAAYAAPAKVANFSLRDGSQSEKLATFSSPTLSGPCAPGAIYESACDVNHDGVVDVFDIQLTAGRWGQTGTWMSDNDHNHLGQTWTGSNNSLKIDGSFGAPNYAALVLSNSNSDGLRIQSAADSGVYVNHSGGDGVAVAEAGAPSGYGYSSAKNGFEVNGAQGNGLFVGQADADGVHVHAAGSASVSTSSAQNNGVEIEGAQGNGMYIGRADSDGIRIRSASDDGIQIGEDGAYPYYGLYIPPPGTTGSALLPNTANASGEWALITTDNINAGNVLLSAQTMLAVVGGDQSLAVGEVVTATGLADALPGSHNRLAQVQRAGGGSGIVGVVISRMVLQAMPDKDGAEELHSIDGAAQPGDYVAIAVL